MRLSLLAAHFALLLAGCSEAGRSVVTPGLAPEPIVFAATAASQSIEEVPLEYDVRATMNFIDWDVLVRYRYGVEDVKRTADRQGEVLKPSNRRTLAAVVRESQSWDAVSELPSIDGRFYAVVQIEGMGAQELFASRFYICNLTLSRCRDNDEAFRVSVLILAESEFPKVDHSPAP